MTKKSNKQYYDKLFKLADGARGSMLYSYASKTVSEHFRSMHYLSSTLICDCVVLNLLLHDDITQSSGKSIVKAFRSKHKSFYTTVKNAFIPIFDDFAIYARNILGDKFQSISFCDSDLTAFIVYVISLDIKNKYTFDKREVYFKACDYADLLSSDE